MVPENGKWQSHRYKLQLIRLSYQSLKRPSIRLYTTGEVRLNRLSKSVTKN